MNISARSLVWLLAAILCGGCDRSAPSQLARPVVKAGTGVITGVVYFDGPPRAVKIIGGPCCPGSPAAVDESLVVADGRLKNVVISIENGPNVLTDTKDAVLAQKDCVYVPHVLAIRTGQNLVVTNHDQTLHNVNIQSDAGDSHNEQESFGESRSFHFDQPGEVRAKCNVHPWMTAYVRVFDHPFFSVSDSQGRFSIDRLPAGTYTLVAWHEQLGELRQTVTIRDASPVDLHFDYQP